MEDDDYYEYRAAPASTIAGNVFDEDLYPDLERAMEWAENIGFKAIITSREGAAFVFKGKLSIIALYGGQPIHHDRHMMQYGEDKNHTWNIICSGGENQIPLTEIKQDIFNHITMRRGSVIYLNTTNRHLVSRKEGDEQCILLQIDGYGPDEKELALSAIVSEWKKQKRKSRSKMTEKEGAL